MNISEGERIRTRAETSSPLILPAVRSLAHGAGIALLICAAAAVVELCLVAASGEHAIPAALSSALIAALGVVQIVSALLIWRIFTGTRRRFLQRIQAATGSLDDRIFLADVQGTTLSFLTEAGWTLEPLAQWSSGSIHPDDRARWPAAGAAEALKAEIRLKDANGEWRWHRLRATPLQDESGRVREWVGSLHDIHEQRLASEHRDLVIAELRHRLKNLITVIDALAKNSRRAEEAEPGVASFLQRYLGRLHALGAAGDILLASGDSVETLSLVQTTLAPFMTENAQRIRVSGPTLQLREELGAGLGLAVHELATNALKYGALSVPEGIVSFSWTATQNGAGREVVFRWDERGGPPPSPPQKSGFGVRMIKHVAAREKSGRVDIEYPPEGLTCRIAFVLDNAAGADPR